jgi:DNA-binding NtrC family response regulator
MTEAGEPSLSTYKKLLVLEDIQEANAVQHALEKSKIQIEVMQSERVEKALDHLHNRNVMFDAVLSDYELTDKSGLELLNKVRKSGIDLPFGLFNKSITVQQFLVNKGKISYKIKI